MEFRPLVGNRRLFLVLVLNQYVECNLYLNLIYKTVKSNPKHKMCCFFLDFRYRFKKQARMQKFEI